MVHGLTFSLLQKSTEEATLTPSPPLGKVDRTKGNACQRSSLQMYVSCSQVCKHVDSVSFHISRVQEPSD